MLFYRAALPLSHKTLTFTFTAGIIRRHRRAIRSAWRKLELGQQALLVLAYLRKARHSPGWPRWLASFVRYSSPKPSSRAPARTPKSLLLGFLVASVRRRGQVAL
jgi:hypothetical protein